MRFVSCRLLAVILLAFSTPTLADSIDYQGTGSLLSGTAFTLGTISVGHTWEVGDRLVSIFDLTNGHHETGNLGAIDVTTGPLVPCEFGLCFVGGTLDIDNILNKDLTFEKLTLGSIASNGGITVLSAHLEDGAVAVLKVGRNSFSTQVLLSPVPEPGTLLLVGTGLVLVSGVAWKKRRFPCSNKS